MPRFNPLSFSLKFILLFVMLSPPLWSWAQLNNQEVDQLNKKADQFYYTADSMVYYARKAHELAIEKKYKNGEAVALKFMGIFEQSKNNYDEALKLLKQALTLLETVKNDFEAAKTTLSISSVYNEVNDHVNSVNYALKSLQIFERLKDIKGQGKVLNILGIANAKQGNFKQAKIYFLQYNAIAKKVPDAISLGYSFNNLGGVNRDLKLIDSALFYFKIANNVFKKTGHLAGISLAVRNIGAIYYDKKDFKNALFYAKQALETSLTSKDKLNTCIAYKDMATCYRELRDTANAYIVLKKAITIAQQIGQKEVLRDSYAILAELDKGQENYKSAYENLLASRAAHDSLLNTEKTKIVEDLTAKYETVKKEKEIKSLNQQSTIQKLQLKQRNIWLIIAFSLLVIGAVLSYLFYSKRKLKEQTRLQAEINKQQEQTTKAILSAEENERSRIAADLHDGVGQLLSAALMSFNGLAKEYNYSNAQEKEKTANVLSLLNQSYDEMRSISHQMMPNALIKAGLTAAVKDFLNKIDKEKLKISLETIGLNSRLDAQVESVLYRVIQETVNNVIKHAKANKLNIQFLKDEEGTAITIEDDGIGFNTTLLKDSEGIGLKNIVSRIAFLKGTIDFDSAIGKGTLVAIHIPN